VEPTSSGRQSTAPSLDADQIVLRGADVDGQRQHASGDERCSTRLAHSTVNSGYSVD